MYLHFREQVIDDFSEENIEAQYERGFVFTRLGKGVMQEIRSLRVNLKDFELSSENRRVLRKTAFVSADLETLPYKNYHWSLGKMAADFYHQKFGGKIMSANKIKEMLTDPEKSNMNAVFIFRDQEEIIGAVLLVQTKNILHYAYPFYHLERVEKKYVDLPLGMGLMTKAVVWAKEKKKQYVYLGSVSDSKAKYKLQFAGLEWWNQKNWSRDIKSLKEIIAGKTGANEKYEI